MSYIILDSVVQKLGSSESLIITLVGYANEEDVMFSQAQSLNSEHALIEYIKNNPYDVLETEQDSLDTLSAETVEELKKLIPIKLI